MPGQAIRFRHSSALTVAAVIAMIAMLSLYTWAPYLLVLLVIPLAVAIWSWRTGTDADADAITVRAALTTRRIPWAQVSGFAATRRGVEARLATGAAIDLPAVTAADLPRLVAASGTDLVQDSQ